MLLTIACIVGYPRLVRRCGHVIRILRDIVHVITVVLLCCSGRVPDCHVYCELLQFPERATN